MYFTNESLTHSQRMRYRNSTTTKAIHINCLSLQTFRIHLLGIDLLHRDLEFFYTMCELRSESFIYLEAELALRCVSFSYCHSPQKRPRRL